jgi:hypothetical protein
LLSLSLYFHDPDDNVMEFCAWPPAYDQLGRDHKPLGKSNAVGIERPADVPQATFASNKRRVAFVT